MNHHLKCTCKLAALMRSCVPVPGTDFERLILVDLKAGEGVGLHQHSQHTVLYYPADASPVWVSPVAGMIIYLPPDTPHAVTRTRKDRLSAAMLVEPVTT